MPSPNRESTVGPMISRERQEYWVEATRIRPCSPVTCWDCNRLLQSAGDCHVPAGVESVGFVFCHHCAVERGGMRRATVGEFAELRRVEHQEARVVREPMDVDCASLKEFDRKARKYLAKFGPNTNSFGFSYTAVDEKPRR